MFDTEVGKRFMSRDTYHNPTVPYYCHIKTPRIDPFPKPISEHALENKIFLMKLRKFLRQWVRENWQQGERFRILEIPADLPDSYRWRNAGKTGTFVELFTNGMATQVKVIWDDGAKHTLGMHDLYRYAVKLDVESISDAPCG